MNISRGAELHARRAQVQSGRILIGELGASMCLSQSVSFSAGGILIAGGAFASAKAWSINKRYLSIAVLPVMAGVQQVTEGHVWMGMTEGDPAMVWWAAMGFIFFSWFMWPVWIPIGVYMLEAPQSSRKRALLMFALAGAALGLVLYVPHLFNPDWVNVRINNRSLAYEDTMFLDYLIPRWLTYAIYLFLIISPPILSSYFHMKMFGVTIIVVLAIVYSFLTYAYISFFCLLAGAGTVHLIYIILRNKCRLECPVLFR